MAQWEFSAMEVQFVSLLSSHVPLFTAKKSTNAWSNLKKETAWRHWLKKTVIISHLKRYTLPWPLCHGRFLHHIYFTVQCGCVSRQRMSAFFFWCFISVYFQSIVSFTKSREPVVSSDYECLFFQKNTKVRWISLQENWTCDSCILLKERTCASVLFRHVLEQKERGLRIDMDINRSRYLQKWWARCAVLYLSSQIRKTVSVGDLSKQVAI